MLYGMNAQADAPTTYRKGFKSSWRVGPPSQEFRRSAPAIPPNRNGEHMSAAPSYNPLKHLRRAANLREQHLVERAKALAPALSSPEAAKRLGISQTEAEQLAARHGFYFKFHKDDY